MKVLVTGGLGYIGSHTVVECLNKDYSVVVVDNLYNSKIETKGAIEKITGKTFTFYKKDLLDYNALLKIFKKEKPDAVIHFAGLKAVGESVEKPLMYYNTNINTTLNLVNAMEKTGVNNLIFSSSATVYNPNNPMPLKETSELGGENMNPYGRTKLTIEYLLKDYAKANPHFNVTLLRYFNPIGAHESGLIGEDPNGIPNNLMPYITKVATGKLEKLSIFGNDYDTKDGTCIRDYIHVCDLADAHIKALEHMKDGVSIYNVGTGKGYSVLDIVNTFEKENKLKLNYQFAGRRAGDAPICYSSAAKAKKELDFTCKRKLSDMVKSAYTYEKNHN